MFSNNVTGITESQMQENIVCNEAIAFLREHVHKNPNKPYFLCASFSRPHFPLTAPERFIEPEITEDYCLQAFYYLKASSGNSLIINTALSFTRH